MNPKAAAAWQDDTQSDDPVLCVRRGASSETRCPFVMGAGAGPTSRWRVKEGNRCLPNINESQKRLCVCALAMQTNQRHR
jgi:hypothetical protein